MKTFTKILFASLAAASLVLGLAHSYQTRTQSHQVALPKTLPISVKLDPSQDGRVLWLEVTSLVDQITVNDIIINRGNCHLSSQLPTDENGRTLPPIPYSPKTLKFGEFTMDLPIVCQVLEADVSTDQGNFQFNWMNNQSDD
jgi:hypothetical protein